MKPRFKKNVQPVLSDIKHPRALVKKEISTGFFKPREESPLFISNGRGMLKKAVIAAVIVSIIVVAGFGWYLWNFKNEALTSASFVYQNLKSASSSLINLENENADSSLKTAEKEIVKLENKASIFSILPILKEIPKTIFQIRDLTVRLRKINENVAALKVEGFKMLFGGGGSELINLLKNVKDDVLTVNGTVSDLRNKASRFGAMPVDVSSQYMALNMKADKLVLGLDSLVSILEKPGETHFIMILENPSEMRPGGGFVGSYADLILESGSIKDIHVDDIYHPDRFLDLKIVPPKQLQGITPNWGARDANWFFNFPDSAKKIVEFLEDSSIYENQGITFHGVIAINVRVMEDILKIIGPIEVPEYDLVLDDTNFLKEVQYEVESGRDKKPGENPKKVLQFIMPKILEKLSAFSKEEKRLVVNALSYRLANKDIKLYLDDDAIENMISEAGFGGEIYVIPANWAGNYLAVVNTNVAGGKTDAFIKQKIELVSKITSEGTVSNNLTITRSHNGQNEKESWYKAVNQNFIKVFAPLDSKLIALTGSTPKKVKPLVSDYISKGYIIDEDLESIEDIEESLKELDVYVYEESGKTVFGAWFNIAAGKTGNLSLTYLNERRNPLKHGDRFQFVLDKQSGVESQFDYILEAPPGFKWKENSDFIYRYKSDTISSRLTIDLTLEAL